MVMFKSFITVAAVLGGLSAVSAESSGVPACDALQDAGLGDRVLLPTDPGYDPEIETWPSENGRLRPYCLVLPHNSQEVSTALTALLKVNNGAGDWHIAIRSGGHSYPGSNNIERGVTIDLSMMNSSSYDPETNIASIQPGGRWANVYADLEKQGVTVVGGRDGTVGVGGFLLGGGISYFSYRMGLGCDSVVNYELVLANGSIINANQTNNADLWRALKGGSGNFGIVTRYDVEALPSQDLFYDIRTLSSEYTDDVVDAVVGFANQDQSFADNALVTYLTYQPLIIPDITVSTIYVNIAGNGNATTAFDKVRSLPALDSVTVMQTMAEAAAGGGFLGGDYRTAASTWTFKNDPQILRGVVELHKDFVGRLNKSIDPSKLGTAAFFQPFPSYMGTISKERGGNMLGLDEVPDNVVVFTGGVGVNGTESEFAFAQAEYLKFNSQVKELSRSMNGDVDLVYLNYAYPFQDPLGSYPPQNIQLIRDMAAAYDPAEVFQKRIPGGFKISRVA